MKGESWRNREVSSEGVSFKLRITNELAVTRWMGGKNTPACAVAVPIMERCRHTVA